MRYLVARKNDPLVVGFDALSARERQAVSLVAMGHSNKSIAYELGLAVSTIGVLLSRASKKLGAMTRRELASRYEAGLRREREGR